MWNRLNTYGTADILNNKSQQQLFNVVLNFFILFNYVQRNLEPKYVVPSFRERPTCMQGQCDRYDTEKDV